MPFVALLRGINVGRAKRLAMADLRALCESLGHGHPRTLLNSGNLVFDADASADPAVLAAELSAAIAARLGVQTRVVVKTAGALRAALGGPAFAQRPPDPSRLMVAFAQQPEVLARLAPLAERDWGDEALQVAPEAAWLWCAHGIIDSPLAAAAARLLRDDATLRNRTTVARIDQLMQPDPA